MSPTSPRPSLILIPVHGCKNPVGQTARTVEAREVTVPSGKNKGCDIRFLVFKVPGPPSANLILR